MRLAASYADQGVPVDIDMRGDDGKDRQPPARTREPERVGQYTLYEEIGCGGMATVHLGQLQSASGFVRTVAIKRMHSELARSPEFAAMFFEEARLAGRLAHPNVVAALDCVVCDGTTLLVMDYVHGASLDEALRLTSLCGRGIPLPIASAILIGALLGLHAAHEAADDDGRSLGIVHRDVSPHNILVGADGLARVLDFGIAKAAERAHHTRTGEIKGKLAYMAPEQLFNDDSLGREADVYSVGVILWELLTGRRLFANDSHGQTLMRVANGRIETPRSVRREVPPEMEAIAMKALTRHPSGRYRTAREFAIALETTCPPASQRIVGDWLASVAAEPLARRWALKCAVDRSRDRPRSLTDSGIRDSVTSRFRQPSTMPPMNSRVTVSLKRPAITTPTARPRLAAVLVVGAVAAASGAIGSLWTRPASTIPPSTLTRDSDVAAAGHTERNKVPPPAPVPTVATTQLSAPAPTDNPVNVDVPIGEIASPDPSAPRNPHPAAVTHPTFRPRPTRVVVAPAPSTPSVTPTAHSAVSELNEIGGRE